MMSSLGSFGGDSPRYQSPHRVKVGNHPCPIGHPPPTSWWRNFNETARYVDQGGGKRKGAFAMYLVPRQ